MSHCVIPGSVIQSDQVRLQCHLRLQISQDPERSKCLSVLCVRACCPEISMRERIKYWSVLVAYISLGGSYRNFLYLFWAQYSTERTDFSWVPRGFTRERGNYGGGELAGRFQRPTILMKTFFRFNCIFALLVENPTSGEGIRSIRPSFQ